jgi:5-methylthioribose kinase
MCIYNYLCIIIYYSIIVVVKQALPYVRCVGESWPLTLDRATFENNALVEQRSRCPSLVPEVLRADMQIYRYIDIYRESQRAEAS